MSKRNITNTVVDPTLPKTPVTIKGKTYNLCFDYGALAIAETELRSQGHEINLLVAFPNPNLANVPIVLAAALRKFHPEISFEDATKLVDFTNVLELGLVIIRAWNAAMPQKEPDPKGEALPGQ